MLRAGDEEWLRETHPGLALVNGAVRGTIEFAAADDAVRNLFQVIDASVPAQIDGVVLTGRFTIRMEKKQLPKYSLHCRRSLSKR